MTAIAVSPSFWVAVMVSVFTAASTARDIPGQALELAGGPRDKLCHACVRAVDDLEVLLSEPSLVAESVRLLEGAICEPLGGDAEQQCDAAVEQYVPVIVEQMQEAVTVDNLCVNTGICPVSPFVPTAPSRLVRVLSLHAASSSLDSPEDCIACRMAIKLLKRHLENPKTQVQIQTYLVSKCNLLTNSTLAAQCTDAVDRFLPLIFSRLDIILDAKKLCKEAGLCLPLGPRGHGLT